MLIKWVNIGQHVEEVALSAVLTVPSIPSVRCFAGATAAVPMPSSGTTFTTDTAYAGIDERY